MKITGMATPHKAPNGNQQINRTSTVRFRRRYSCQSIDATPALASSSLIGMAPLLKQLWCKYSANIHTCRHQSTLASRRHSIAKLRCQLHLCQERFRLLLILARIPQRQKASWLDQRVDWQSLAGGPGATPSVLPRPWLPQVPRLWAPGIGARAAEKHAAPVGDPHTPPAASRALPCQCLQ